MNKLGFLRLRAARQGCQSGSDLYLRAGRQVQPAAIMKSLAERGVTPDKIKIFGTGEIIDDTGLQSVGDAGDRRRHVVSL